MRSKVKRQDKYCFPETLQKKLAEIPFYPLTAVEAPSGFGKTTAVREYIRGNLRLGAREYRYTCLGEPAYATWDGICALLSNIDEKAADALRRLRLPVAETLIEISALSKNLLCLQETYVVIDNYQLFDCDVADELVHAFSMHGNPNLHFILITQQFSLKFRRSFYNGRIHFIQTKDFFFGSESTAKLCRLEGIRLSPEEVDDMLRLTEGWVAAIRLEILNYKEKGSFDYTAGIEQLMEAALWNRLTAREKDFLLSVSVLDAFDARQAAIMLEADFLPEDMELLLKSNEFIRYFPNKGMYAIHSILRDYLRNRFCYYQPQDVQRRTLRMAGQACAAAGEYFAAARFFLQIGDFDAILSLPVDAEYISAQREERILEFIRDLVEQCPDGTLLRYPFALLSICPQMYAGGYFDIYKKLCRQIDQAAQTDQSLDANALIRIRGELALLRLMEDYNDISRMKSRRNQEYSLLSSSSGQAWRAIPFSFGCPSILFLYWRESGEMENILRQMEESMPVYRRFTLEHGAGAESVMKAEALLMRGEEDEAEILCHKALYQAKVHQQTSVSLGAELVLGRIAILRADPDGYLAARERMSEYAITDQRLYVRRMVDLCLMVIAACIGDGQAAVSWMKDMASVEKTLYYPAVPYVRMCYASQLFLQKRYTEFMGFVQTLPDEERGKNENLRYVMPQIYYNKYLAAIKMNGGDVSAAGAYFSKALELALQDRVYLPLAQNSQGMDELFITAKKSVADQRGMEALMALCKRQQKGAEAIRRAMHKNRSPLTPREREVALLVKERFSAQEISEKLHISKATAKTIIRNVYGKLEIHSRSELSATEI